jgi:hypothetical protein
MPERARNANPVAKRIPSRVAPLDRLRLATRQVAKDVTLWPLVLPDAGEACPRADELRSLDEALEDGFVSVRPAAGSARLESRTGAPIWVPAGERVGAAGAAAGSFILPSRGSRVVPCRDPGAAGSVCRRCARALAAGFHAVEGQVGFVWAREERAIALELVLPAGLLRRHLARRVEAWAPWLLGEVAPGPEAGFESPEALLDALRAGRLAGRARAEILGADDTGPWALTM